MCTGRFIPKNQPEVEAKETMPVLGIKQFKRFFMECTLLRGV
jgi:hypothetical protein